MCAARTVNSILLNMATNYYLVHSIIHEASLNVVFFYLLLLCLMSI